MATIKENKTGVTKYKLMKELGSGSFGTTYLARDLLNRRNVAIKAVDINRVLQLGSSLDEILGEVKTLQALSAAPDCYPHVVCYIESLRGDFNGADTLFIVTEYIDGFTLANIKLDAITWGDIYELTSQLTDAVKYVHEKGYAHQDIKPENIMIERSTGLVKLIDFGLACSSKCVSGGGSRPWEPPEYFIPNPPNGLDAAQKHDVWSLGVVFYQLTNGQFPFGNVGDADLIKAIVDNKLEPSDSGDIYIDNIIDSMLTYDWKVRPTIYDVDNRLRSYLATVNLD